MKVHIRTGSLSYLRAGRTFSQLHLTCARLKGCTDSRNRTPVPPSFVFSPPNHELQESSGRSTGQPKPVRRSGQVPSKTCCGSVELAQISQVFEGSKGLQLIVGALTSGSGI